MRIAVVGARGFLGSHVLKALRFRSQAHTTAVVSEDADFEASADEVRFDDVLDWGQFDSVVFAAGSSDHSLGNQSLRAQWQREQRALLLLLDSFSGNLVFVSSQAVYAGEVGYVPLEVHKPPAMPYGLSKLHSEQLVELALSRRMLRSASILRLSYIFGPGERSSRLLARAASTIVDGQKLQVPGRGNSYLNPLPVEYVADLIRAVSLANSSSGELNKFNVRSTELVTVRDVVRMLGRNFELRANLTDTPENWPVRYVADNSSFARLCSNFGLEEPSVSQSICNYIVQRISTQNGSK